jgi:hypothetical protein
MNNIVSLASAQAHKAPVEGSFKTNMSKGDTNMEVNTQWMRRPADQKFLSLDELFETRLAEAEASRADTVDSRKIEVVADATKPTKMSLKITTENGTVIDTDPTHYSFGQACGLVKAPAGYLRRLPGKLAGANLQYGLITHRAELLKSFINTETGELKALNGPDYGRIYDHELVDAIRDFAGDGTSGMWKVPGALDWMTGQYNPHVDVTKHTTTLYASDRDCFIFLVDDTHPIQIGTLKDGSPDLVFRGFYAWNSEVGDKSLGIASMLIRAVCGNRILWGTENFEKITVRHSKFAPSRFAEEIAPALQAYATGSTEYVQKGISAAMNATVAKNREAAFDYLSGLKIGKAASTAIIQKVMDEEGKEPESVWDFIQGITAYARDMDNADDRVAIERIGGNIMAKVAKAA